MRWHKTYLEIKETIVTLLMNPGGFQEAAEQTIRDERKVLEDFIALYPEFGTTHKIWLKDSDVWIVQDMIDASRPFGIGPMAAVAGTFSERILNTVINAGATEAIVDNGGDIAIQIEKPVRIGLFAGESPVKNLAFFVEPRDKPFGICTSSGTVGHSYSYGKADAAIVISENIPLADVAATTLGNGIKDEKDLETCFGIFDKVDAIEGAIVIYRDKIAMWGKLPKLAEANVNPDLITRGGMSKTILTGQQDIE